MNPEDAVPLLLIFGVILLAPRRLFSVRWFEVVIVICLAVVLARYLNWRLWETVWPADLSTFTGLFVWFVFTFEVLSWIDASILFAFLLRRTDHSPAADWHEDRLRDMEPGDLPAVDVFIATYNEPVEVLEKTIAGAAALDWPADRLNVWVLDDGRRDWLRRLAESKGLGYLTRAENRDAKAGNINAAVQVTDAPFILVLDADFIPQKTFLFRAMGFFEDPKVGIVQIPHNFFNSDPMQASLNMSKVMPDDQRFFFEVIMPGRDGYDCAFCCGSNGIIRRSALEEIGNALPSGSITEDMLLTLALKRRGYVTRYLNEPLAFGLAPESINAFFIQRARWARGGIQILFLRNGPLGPGLRWFERLFFLPLHWITQTFVQTLVIATPTFFLLTGIPPLLNTTAGSVLSYQVPAIVATIAAVRLFAPGQYHPLASLALSVLMAFRLLPVVVSTLIKPHGHAFKVTPKGRAGAAVQDSATVFVCLGLSLLTGLGLLLNALPQTQHVSFSSLIPVVTFWSILNMIVLLLVAKIANSPPVLRHEERIDIDEPGMLHVDGGRIPAHFLDMSLNGALLKVEDAGRLSVGDWIGVEIAEVGLVPARVARCARHISTVGVSFRLRSLHDRLQLRREMREAGDRMPVSEAARLHWDDRRLQVELHEISEFGAGLGWPAGAGAPAPDDWVVLELASGSSVPAQVMWLGDDPNRSGWRKAGLQLHVLDTDARERLIEKLFTEGRAMSKASNLEGWSIFWKMLRQIMARDAGDAVAVRTAPTADDILMPPWLQDLMIVDAARGREEFLAAARSHAAGSPSIGRVSVAVPAVRSFVSDAWRSTARSDGTLRGSPLPGSRVRADVACRATSELPRGITAAELSDVHCACGCRRGNGRLASVLSGQGAMLRKLLLEELTTRLFGHARPDRCQKGFLQRLGSGPEYLRQFHEEPVIARFLLHGQAFLGEVARHRLNRRIGHQRVLSVRRRLT